MTVVPACHWGLINAPRFVFAREMLTLWLQSRPLDFQEKQVRLKLNGKQQLVAYADVNLQGNMYTIKKNTETLNDASR
jgi:hypothetical protein